MVIVPYVCVRTRSVLLYDEIGLQLHSLPVYSIKFITSALLFILILHLPIKYTSKWFWKGKLRGASIHLELSDKRRTK